MEQLQNGTNCDQCFEEELGKSVIPAVKYCENCKFFYCQKCWDEQDCHWNFNNHRNLLDPPEDDFVVTDLTPDDFSWDDLEHF